jgi:hypothetical protein
MQYILNCEWVEVILGGEGMYGMHIRQPIHADPSHRGPVWAVPAHELLEVINLIDFNLRWTVICAGDSHFAASAWQAGDFIVLDAWGGSRNGLGIGYEFSHSNASRKSIDPIGEIE